MPDSPTEAPTTDEISTDSDSGDIQWGMAITAVLIGPPHRRVRCVGHCELVRNRPRRLSRRTGGWRVLPRPVAAEIGRCGFRVVHHGAPHAVDADPVLHPGDSVERRGRKCQSCRDVHRLYAGTTHQGVRLLHRRDRHRVDLLLHESMRENYLRTDKSVTTCS